MITLMQIVVAIRRARADDAITADQFDAFEETLLDVAQHLGQPDASPADHRLVDAVHDFLDLLGLMSEGED